MNDIKPIKFILVSLAASFLSACAVSLPSPQSSPSSSPSASPVASATPSQPAAALSRIGYGKSFGMCIGYCDHSLTITAERMRLVHKAFREPDKYPEQVIDKPTPAETWQKLNRLASFQTLQSLPDRIGCPDCADGGAEWVELQQGSTKRVTFEPQAGLPQQAELLAELRKLYQELTPQNPAS